MTDVTGGPDGADELRDLAVLLPEGDELAWQRVYTVTHLPLLRMLRRSLRNEDLAEEALQATFVTAVERIDTYDPAKGTIDAWLAGIARYKALELRRSQRTAQLAIDPVDAMSIDDSPDAELIALTLDRLEPRYAEALRRKYLLEQSLAQMSEELGLPQGTVGTLIHRGRRRFRELYKRMLAAADEPHRRAAAEH